MEKRRVLVLLANPRGTVPLRLGEEDRTIRECVRLSAQRSLDVITHHAATVDDLRRALLEHRPQILHISGHGSDEGLSLEDNSGEEHRINPEALAELVALSKPPVEIVFLNACFSATHADEFASFKVPCLIAMSTSVTDAGAIEFTRGFYDSLAAGEDVQSAFDHGRVNMKAHGLDDHVVALHQTAAPPVGPVIAEPIPAVERPAPPVAVQKPKRRFFRLTWLRAGALLTFILSITALTGQLASLYDFLLGK